VASVGALLKLGVITPVAMVADVWLAQKLFPGFDPGAQFISELGGPAAPTPEIFNLGRMLARRACSPGPASPMRWKKPAAAGRSRPSPACGWR
jgi:hypothetical protein